MSVFGIRWLTLVVSSILVITFTALARSGQVEPDWLIGKQIYETGLLPSGQTIPLRIGADIAADGKILNCASCHRNSGYGDGEGGSYVPPITGPALFSERTPDRARLFRSLFQDIQSEAVRAGVRHLQQRSAYNEETLLRALRQGLDADGRPLNTAMPRFQITSENARHLAEYLRRLGSENDPGVDDEVIHFATIFVPDVSETERDSVLSVLNAYFKRKNNTTLQQQSRPDHSMLFKRDMLPSYRRWQLHVWHLQGPPETWGQQMQNWYQQQPVFAVVGGLDTAENPDWQAIHRFCEQTALPCLFPNTQRPVTHETGRYNLYLSRGLEGEANALASWVDELSRSQTHNMSVLQIYSLQNISEAKTVDQRLATLPGVEVVSVDLEDYLDGHVKSSLEGSREGPTDSSQQSAPRQPDVLLLWLNRDAVKLLPSYLQKIRYIGFSSTLMKVIWPNTDRELWSGMTNRPLYITWPWSMTGSEAPRLYRVRSWLRSRRIPVSNEALQLNTYFAASIVDNALTHILDRFSRDYLIEVIEHLTENTLNPGHYPRMSLGPDQRFAAKGCYIVKLEQGQLRIVKEWISR
jgi:hypothetical protein